MFLICDKRFGYPVILSELIGIFMLMAAFGLVQDGLLQLTTWQFFVQVVFFNALFYVDLLSWTGLILILIPIVLWLSENWFRSCIIFSVMMILIGAWFTTKSLAFAAIYAIIGIFGLLYTLLWVDWRQ